MQRGTQRSYQISQYKGHLHLDSFTSNSTLYKLNPPLPRQLAPPFSFLVLISAIIILLVAQGQSLEEMCRFYSFIVCASYKPGTVQDAGITGRQSWSWPLRCLEYAEGQHGRMAGSHCRREAGRLQIWQAALFTSLLNLSYVINML